MSLFSIYLGYLAYGGFRGQTLIPQNAGENDICGLTGRKMLANSDGSGAGNFACEGCSDTVNVVDWDIANVQTSTEGRYSEGGVEGGLNIRYKQRFYEVLDGNGEYVGQCLPTGSTEVITCTVGGDTYEVVKMFDCDLDIPLRWE